MLFSRIPLSLYQTFASLSALCVSPTTKSVRRILVSGVSAPLPPEAKKILKFYYEMVHSEVYLDKYVVSIAPFSPPPIRKTALFCMFSLFNFSSIFPWSADPICLYVRTPMPTTIVHLSVHWQSYWLLWLCCFLHACLSVKTSLRIQLLVITAVCNFWNTEVMAWVRFHCKELKHLCTLWIAVMCTNGREISFMDLDYC